MPQEWLMGLGGGLLIGLAAAVYLLGNARIMGASGLLGALLDGSGRDNASERIVFIAALVIAGGLAHGLLGGETHLTDNGWLLGLGGLLTGIGTRWANGCTSGHGVCGISRLSLRGIVASALYVGAGMGMVSLMRLWMVGA